MQESKTRKSVTALKQALLTWMKKKPLSKITVTELCGEAGLNRSTFYANYSDIHDLILDIHTDIFRGLAPTLIETGLDPHTGTMASRIAAVTEIISYLQDNLDVFGTLFTNNEDNLFEKHLSDYYLKIYAVRHNDKKTQYILLYHLIGSFSMVHQWITDRCPCTPQELAELICEQSRQIAPPDMP